MKIEVEFDYVETLRKENEKLRLQIDEMKGKLSMLDPVDIEYKANKLAKTLATTFLISIFKKLGFSATEDMIKIGDSFTWVLAKDWEKEYKHYDIEVGALVSDRMRKAFMRIGVDPNYLSPENKKANQERLKASKESKKESSANIYIR